MNGPELRKLQRKLEGVRRDILSAGSSDVEAALRLLREESIPEPASLPTRQQRRAAARAAQKAGRR